MAIPEKVDNCPVCEPVKHLLSFLLEKKFAIKEQRCRDIHFHELYFKLHSDNPNSEIEIQIERIHKHEKGFFYCDCHWSTVVITP